MSLAARDRMTVEEFLAIDELPPYAELIDGAVVVSDPTFRHNEIVLRLVLSYAGFAGSNSTGLGRIGVGSTVRAGAHDGFVPDVWWVPAGTVLDPAENVFPRAPDIAMEVRSPTTWPIDRGRKLRGYETLGVAAVWLVDGIDDEVTVHRRSTGSDVFDVVSTLRPGDTLTTPLVPGWAIDLAELLAR